MINYESGPHKFSPEELEKIKIPTDERKLPPFELDFSSSDRFYETLIDQVITNLRRRRNGRGIRTDDDRQRDIITMHASGKTLDEIGKLFGVTRERIRQIERKVWTQIAFFKPQMKSLESILVSMMRRNGGFDRLENLQAKLKDKLGWSEKEVNYLLTHYLEQLSTRFLIVDEEYLVLTDHLCWKCDYFHQEVKKSVERLEKENGSLTIHQFAKEVEEHLEVSPECLSCKSPSTTYSPELFLWLFKNDPDLQRSQEKMTIRETSHFLGLNRSVLLVLKIAKRALTKQEILDQLKTIFPRRTFTLKQIQSTTSNSPQCSDAIFLWDRGGIHSETLYIHKDYIPVNGPVLDKIEKRLLSEAKTKKVPQIRLNRIYNEFADECAEQGIPNVYALFSALKVRACSGFIFQRSPYIGFAGNTQKISNAKILEDFVRRCQHPVTRQEMREFGRTLGLQNEHISNTIVLTKLIPTLHGYIYRSDEPEKTPEFQGIVNRVQKALLRAPSVSVNEVFKKESEICQKLDILDSKMLYSLLRRGFPKSFSFKFPLVFPASKRKSGKISFR